jgi:hypothetical protein
MGLGHVLGFFSQTHLVTLEVGHSTSQMFS